MPGFNDRLFERTTTFPALVDDQLSETEGVRDERLIVLPGVARQHAIQAMMAEVDFDPHADDVPPEAIAECWAPGYFK